MKSYHITFSSKNKNSLTTNFLFFINSSTLNFNIVKKYSKRKTKKHFLTILKSPHVNKSAQEQFDSYIFSKQLTVFSTKKLKYLYFLKKIKNNLLSDVKFDIKCSSNQKKKNNLRIQILNPNNFILNSNQNFLTQKKMLIDSKDYFFNKQNNKKVKLLLQTLDIYGEFIQKLV